VVRGNESRVAPWWVGGNEKMRPSCFPHKRTGIGLPARHVQFRLRIGRDLLEDLVREAVVVPDGAVIIRAVFLDVHALVDPLGVVPRVLFPLLLLRLGNHGRRCHGEPVRLQSCFRRPDGKVRHRHERPPLPVGPCFRHDRHLEGVERHQRVLNGPSDALKDFADVALISRLELRLLGGAGVKVHREGDPNGGHHQH
jgi:hypothetical protein